MLQDYIRAFGCEDAPVTQLLEGHLLFEICTRVRAGATLGRHALRRRRRSAARDAETAERVKFNLMGAGGLRTYISFTRIGDQPSR
jgi:hypothetical protein